MPSMLAPSVLGEGTTASTGASAKIDPSSIPEADLRHYERIGAYVPAEDQPGSAAQGPGQVPPSIDAMLKDLWQ